MKKNPQEVTELEWLKWFYINCDFGPAHTDVILELQREFEERTGRKIPEDWRIIDE